MNIQHRSAYISRNLQAQSPFWLTLKAHDVAVEGQSLIQFNPVPFDVVPDTDWIFFYSPRAVRFFFESLSQKLSSGIRFGAIGASTAQALEGLWHQVDFTGTGEPETTAAAFLQVAKGQRVLFPQARHSRKSVQTRLAGSIQTVELTVYDNRPLQNFPQRRNAVLVFTSPMNAKTYLSRYSLLEGQGVVAIGSPTAQACQAFDLLPVVANAPNEEALAMAVLSCLGE